MEALPHMRAHVDGPAVMDASLHPLLVIVRPWLHRRNSVVVHAADDQGRTLIQFSHQPKPMWSVLHFVSSLLRIMTHRYCY